MEFLKKIFLFRGILQIFVLDKDELEVPSSACQHSGLSHSINQSYSCVGLTDGIDFSYSNQKLSNYGVSYKCVHPSLLAWFIFIQYFLLIKLFLPTLLTAMFSSTNLRVERESAQLWMFQRYEIVLEYEKRLPFSPPFTVFFYVFMILRSTWNKFRYLAQRCKICCTCFCLRHRKQNSLDTSILGSKLTSSGILNNTNSNQNANSGNNQQSNTSANSRPPANVFNYWRNIGNLISYLKSSFFNDKFYLLIAQKYSNDLEKESNESKQKKLDTNLTKVRIDLGTQKNSLQRLNDRVINLEQVISQNQSYLEQIRNLLTQKDSKTGLINRKKPNYIHILSRESPYLNTNIPRFFVYEKLVSWDCSFDLYDPPFISLGFETFKVFFFI